MSYSLPLDEPLRRQGWKVKIRDKKRVEEPHATIIRGKQVWRFGLRSQGFSALEPEPRLVPVEVVDVILDAMEAHHAEWDEAYPETPVRSAPDDAG